MRVARIDWRVWMVASLLGHVFVVLVGVRTVRSRRAGTRPRAQQTSALVAFDLPRLAETPASITGPRRTMADPTSPSRAAPAQPDPLGGTAVGQNVDSSERGERGDGRSEQTGRMLTAHTDPVNLSPHTLNTLEADQEHRLRTARDRASWQDARHTPNPGYDPWISSNAGVLLYRLPNATRVPARGAVTSPGAASIAGSVPTPIANAGVGRPLQPANVVGATRHAAAGITAGVASGPQRVAGPSATARASIESGHASTTADQNAERPRDDVDAEALATTLLRNSIATSVHAGVTRGAGEGGVGGGGAAGSGGGTAEGGRARPFGEGEGWLSLASPDGRYVRYFQLLRRRIDSLWADAFPREEALRLNQGTVILGFVLNADGQVRGVHVRRHSGIERFDQNVVAAITHARLPPIPAELRRDELRLTVPFVFRNPIVR